MSSHSMIQPINIQCVVKEPSFPQAVKQPPKSPLMRFLERQFIPKTLSGGRGSSKDNSQEFDLSSVCLRTMVQNYIEDLNPKRQSESTEEKKISNGNLEKLKNLLQCANISERNLESKVKELVEEYDPRLQILVDELVKLGYDVAICKSSWEFSRRTLCPAGDYEYLDVNIREERVLIGVDFKSKFEIVRPTKAYKAIAETLPYIFVGKTDRLKKIVATVSRAAKESLKKEGLHVPPWRKAQYMLTKWTSPYVRSNAEA